MHHPAAGRNRSANVVIPPFLLAFIRKLGWATGHQDQARRATEGGRIKPGSYGERFGDSTREVGVSLLWDSLLSKFDDGVSSDQKEAACWQRFDQAEEMCLETNERFRNLLSWPDLTHPLGHASVIATARSKIEWLLGPYSESEHEARCSFSSGASTRLPRRYGRPAFKYSGVPETTLDNANFGASCIAADYRIAGGTLRSLSLWYRATGGELRLVEGNRVTSVAKNYKTNRAIAIEPDLNMYVQKGLGAMIRRRLKRVGVDLDDQTINQRGAFKGSCDDSLATIDLSMASDTISFEVVKALLPPDWFDALVACRSHKGSSASNGREIVYEKFSSMGNGATFELESLIFWALSAAACDAHGSDSRQICVYGDDLVIPTRSAQFVCDILHATGFRVNTDKSHFSGAYRESCGKHYWNGSDVTPFFVKAEDATLQGLFKLHNQLYRWCYRTSHTREGWEKIQAVLKWLRSRAPDAWQRPRIPDGIGDGAFVGSFDQCCPQAVRPALHGFEGWRVKVLTWSNRRPARKRRPKGIKGPIRVSASLRLSIDGFLTSVLAPRAEAFLPHLWDSAPPWPGLSQDLICEVRTVLVPHFP
jgi:hypothetical protein